MRNDPPLIHGIAMESSGKLVIDAAARHLLQSHDECFSQSLPMILGILVNQQIEHCWMRKLGGIAKTAVSRVEHLQRCLHNLIDDARRKVTAPAHV